MVILKCADIALQTLSPGTHFTCRGIYDLIGPLLGGAYGSSTFLPTRPMWHSNPLNGRRGSC